MQWSQAYQDLPVRYKLLLSYSAIFVVAIALGSVVIYSVVLRTVESNIDSELSNSTAATLNMVKTSVAVSIKNYLRAVAEKNRDIAEHFHGQYKQGNLSEEDAKARAKAVFLSQKIGETGYLYCVNSSGVVIAHHQKALKDLDVSGYPFVREQMSKKEGYIEYDWKNPDEAIARPKALYMTYFAPWDWIISASSYRHEFSMLVNTADFRDSVMSLRFGKTGYSFICDSKGNILVHPKYPAQNLLDSLDANGLKFFDELCAKKNGRITYSWKNPGEADARMKLVIFNYLPELDWILGSSGYLDEFYAPLETVRNAIFATVAASLLLVLPITTRVSSSITNPLQALMGRFAQGTKGDLTVRAESRSRDELGQLAWYFNAFMERLESYNKSLREEIADRKQAEEALRTSEEMFSKAFQLSPHGICIISLHKLTFINVNDSFWSMTGYTADDVIGKTPMELDFFPNLEEARGIVDSLDHQGHLRNRETMFMRKGGDLRTGVLSAELIELRGEPAILCTVEDVTDARRLEKEIMNIADSERRNIGQDLHDDLGPHLIGIEVLSKVLSKKLSEKALEEATYADRIRSLIGEAIDKTRSLARGLCPVHLVAEGLEAALKELAEKTQDVFGVSCVLQCDHTVLVHDNTMATHLFHIAQEAVNNALKHGKADVIRIELCSDNGMISLIIRDNGRGIPASAPSSGIGLRIMKYRARMIGSSLTIGCNGDSGTVVTCSPRAHAQKG
jgi:PAS domain S-box-containing protein